jgi:nitrate reductase NapE component
MKRLILALVLIALALWPAVALAADGSEPPAFDAFLEALAGPLIAAAVALALSVVVEYVPKYEKLDPKWKRLLFFGLCLFVPIAAVTLRGLLGYAAWSFDPLYWRAIWNGMGAAGVGTLAHIRKL